MVKVEDGFNKTKIYTYVYDNENIILEYLTKSDEGRAKVEVTRYVQGLGTDEHLAVEKKDKPYFYHADGLGSVIALTDSKQKVAASYQYDAFGNVERKGDSIKQPYTYTGREWDEEIGLYYYRARYYDAKAGRFVSNDPAKEGRNYYAYVFNNPINYIDPSGLCCVGTRKGQWLPLRAVLRPGNVPIGKGSLPFLGTCLCYWRCDLSAQIVPPPGQENLGYARTTTGWVTNATSGGLGCSCSDPDNEKSWIVQPLSLDAGFF